MDKVQGNKDCRHFRSTMSSSKDSAMWKGLLLNGGLSSTLMLDSGSELVEQWRWLSELLSNEPESILSVLVDRMASSLVSSSTAFLANFFCRCDPSDFVSPVRPSNSFLTWRCCWWRNTLWWSRSSRKSVSGMRTLEGKAPHFHSGLHHFIKYFLMSLGHLWHAGCILSSL